jgi:drug/metabolite transporter (DMT)-like permease
LPLVAILTTVLCISGGQMLFKLAAARANAAGSFFSPEMLKVLLPACVLYAGATLVWVWALRYVPLNVAYVFMALSFVVVPGMSVLFFKEPLSLRQAAGLILIVAGIIVSLTTRATP